MRFSAAADHYRAQNVEEGRNVLHFAQDLARPMIALAFSAVSGIDPARIPVSMLNPLSIALPLKAGHAEWSISWIRTLSTSGSLCSCRSQRSQIEGIHSRALSSRISPFTIKSNV